MRKIVLVSAAATCAIAAALASTANAQANRATQNPQSDGSTQIGDVIVTAQKRSENIQKIAASVTAVTSAKMDAVGVNNVTDLTGLAPNVQASHQLGMAVISIRGIGTNEVGIGADPNIAFNLDGVYIGRPRAQTAALFDVQQIEILRGPQGDLYGRNATGGAINVVSRAPTSVPSGRINLQFGNYTSTRVEAALSGPLLSDIVTGRIAFYMDRHDGYGRNIATGAQVDNLNSYGGRLRLAITPNDRLRIDISGDIYNAKDRDGAIHIAGPASPGVPLAAVAAGGIFTSNPRDISSLFDPARSQATHGASVTVSYKISDNATIKSISGYRDSNFFYLSDIAGASALPAPIYQIETQKQYSQEFQLSVTTNRLDAIVGAYYLQEQLKGSVIIPLDNYFYPGAVFYQSGGEATQAYAAYARVGYNLTSQLKAIVGLRYSDEFKDGSSGQVFGSPPATPAGGSKSWGALTPTAVLQYTPNPDLMVYGSITRGFKSGAWPIGQAGPPLNPEYVWSYEVGLKSKLFDGRATFNASAFYYDYSDLQVTVINVVPEEENAAKATIKGLEAEFSIQPVQHLRIDATAAYLDAVYDTFKTADPVNPPPFGDPLPDWKGKQLNNAPKWQLSADAEYTVRICGGDLIFGGDIRYIDKVYFTPQNMNNAYAPAYATIDGKITYRFNNKLSIGLFGHNLTGVAVPASQSISSNFFGFPRITFYNDPRTFGVELNGQF